MSAKNEPTFYCLIVSADGEEQWNDTLYQSQIDEYRAEEYSVIVISKQD